ncbi:hypothetical protein PR003_g4711 [Phytophthora rubi]|uniref:Uncharacterized protein n=1 Tax=Phytophthora rubi TaxID=129364 RepID=A0A6A4FS65_9STRA|nr:hypothetical protein PR001_g4557 [Phytophthora rubi]KAE9351799.1 hypothetical protein PR003_g4711 [Phytophthora rubi]
MTGCRVFRLRFLYIYRRKEIQERTMRTGKSTRGKEWTSGEVMVLVTAWKHAIAETLPIGHTTDPFYTSVYDIYVEALGRLVGSTGKPAWFDLEPEERTRVLQKWKRVVIAEQCYGALSGVFEDEPSVHPVNGGVEVGADETEASTTPVPPDTTSKSKKRTRDAAADMEVVMDKAVKAVRKASRREFEEYSKQPERRTRRRTLCYASCSVVTEPKCRVDRIVRFKLEYNPGISSTSVVHL